MVIKVFIVLMLLVILFCLGSGLFYLTKRPGTSGVAKALTWRIILSLGLFVFILVAFFFGGLSPRH